MAAMNSSGAQADFQPTVTETGAEARRVLDDDSEIASHPETDALLDGELGDSLYRAQFVAWFRAVAPYIHAFKRKIFSGRYGITQLQVRMRN